MRPATILFALVLFWTCWPPPLPARQPSESELSALTQSLLTADRLLSELEQLLQTQTTRSSELVLRLGQAQRQLSTLDGALQLWQEHSTELETSLESSSSALQTLRLLYGELESRYAVLSGSWAAYREEALRQTAVRDRQIRIWRGVAIIGSVVAVGLGWLLGRSVLR